MPPGITSTSRPALTEVDRIVRVVVKHPREAFGGPAVIEAEWHDLGFTGPPDFARAIEEDLRPLPGVDRPERRGDSLAAEGRGRRPRLDLRARCIDRLRTRCHPLRDGQTAAGRRTVRAGNGVQGVGHSHRRPHRASRNTGRRRGGVARRAHDAVGRGYRTNDEGIRQLRALLGDSIDELIEVPLPHWRGPGDVFHLMSVISPVADDVAVVYSPLMPVPFRERLLARGIHLVDVPDEEFDSIGANVLAIGPRHAVMVAGNPRTRARLEAADVRVDEYRGREISLKGGGGPNCLTRPIARVSS